MCACVHVCVHVCDVCVCVMNLLLFPLYMLLLAPVFDNSSAPAVDKMVNYPKENVVPGEYLVIVEPNTDCECHMVYNVVM